MQSATSLCCFLLLLACSVSAFSQTAPPTLIDFEQFTGMPSLFSSIKPPLTVDIATFSGGELLNAATFLPADPSVVYGTAATSSTLGTVCTGCLPSITIDFAEAVSNCGVFLINGNIITVTYSIRDDRGGIQSITLPPNFQSGAGVVSLPSVGIRQVVITGDAAEWDFFVDNVTFVKCAVNSVTAKTNKNCDPNINPNCSPNIVLADGSDSTELTVEVQPAQAVPVHLSADFGNPADTQTDSTGKVMTRYASGVLPFGGTATQVGTISATVCKKDFSDLERVFNYRGFEFHLSNVSNAAFVDSAAMDTAAIQGFFAARGSFLARFILVGRIGGFLDTNNNGVLDAGEPTYSAMGTPIPVGVRGMSAAEVFARMAVIRGINPKVLLATAEKEMSLISRSTLPAGEVLNFAMGCRRPSNFVDQMQCAATTLANHFNDRTAFGRAVSYPFFFHASDGIQHNVSGTGRQQVGFAVLTAATYAQYRYTPFIQSLPNGGGVYLFETLWQAFGF